MDEHTIRKTFNEAKARHNIDFEPKEDQIKIASSVLQNRNVLGLLPTGFGKTLCMVMPTIVREDDQSIVLVVSPLTSLMDEHVSLFRTWNFKCAKIESISEMLQETVKGITLGNFQFVFASPESVLKQHWKKIFLSTEWQKKLQLIVIDEAHCISEWGCDFRKDYRQLAELRSFFSVPIMALTATSTATVKDDIMRYLQLTEKDTDVVFRSPDRPNIYIQVMKKGSTDYAISLKWLIDHIAENGISSKKVIVYCRSIDAVSEIFLTLKTCLGPHAYASQIQDASHLLVEMFHKSTHPDSKARILAHFKENDSSIRCIIATVALGMGLDIRDIDVVVHIGCPISVLSYWQEAGRCARDGRQGLSLILYDNFTLSLKTTEKDIATIIRNENTMCIRQQILDVLSVGEKATLQSSSCDGCDLDQCLCAACKCCSVCCLRCVCNERTEKTTCTIKFM